jgi:methionine-rich copper-binding protein CopC
VNRIPSGIVLRFNSRIEKALSRVTVTGPRDEPLPLPQAAPNAGSDRLVVQLPSLEPGVYLVRWKVLSADGHVTQGAFRFTVAQAR